MATYEIETDGGKYQIETEEAPQLPASALQDNVATPHGYPEPQFTDNPAAGEEKPVEQRLAENAVTAGSGVGMPEGVLGLAKAGAGLIGKAVPATEGGTGLFNTMGQYAKRFGQNQAMKAMGASGGQIGQVGVPESRALAQMAIDKGIVSPLRGPIGLEEKVAQLHGQAGADIGAMRNAADKAGTAPQMPEILQAVKQNLEGKYASGTEKGMAGLNRAREEIAKGGTGTFLGNAQKATDLNASAAKNAMYRPQGAATDTADILSRLNNEKMASILSPEQLAKYEAGRKDYGSLEKIKGFLERGERKEMAGRGGSSLTKTLADKTMDALGNRLAATTGSKIGDVLPKIQPFVDPTKKTLEAYLMSLYGNQNAQ